MNKTRVLEIAQAIENDPDHYDQRSGNQCIGGFCRKALKAKGMLAPNGIISYDQAAKLYLDLEGLELPQLVSGHPLYIEASNISRTPTAREAAYTLRHLAETGKVDWQEGAAAAKRASVIDELRSIDVPVKVLEDA